MSLTLPVSGADLQDLQRKRKLVLLVGIAFCIALILVTDSSWRVAGSRIHRTVQWTGLLLMLFCILGRTWCTLYIGGLKKRELVTKGPYSVVRNPLYLFTLFGAGGFGALSGSMVVALVCAGFAAIVFLIVARQEEAFLAAAFPADYPAYAARVPRFWPRLRAWQDADELRVKPHLVHRTFLDASLILLAVPLTGLKALARDFGWISIFVNLP